MSAEDYFESGPEHLNQGQCQKAIDEFKKVLKVNQNHIRSWYDMVVAFRELGEYEKTRGCYQQDIKIDPEMANAWYILGLTYY